MDLLQNMIYTIPVQTDIGPVSATPEWMYLEGRECRRIRLEKLSKRDDKPICGECGREMESIEVRFPLVECENFKDVVVIDFTSDNCYIEDYPYCVVCEEAPVGIPIVIGRIVRPH